MTQIFKNMQAIFRQLANSYKTVAKQKRKNISMHAKVLILQWLPCWLKIMEYVYKETYSNNRRMTCPNKVA